MAPLKPPKPKLPKPKKSLGQHIKDNTRKAAASGLRNNFGVLGEAIAKRYLAPPRVKKPIKVETLSGDKKINKKKLKETAPPNESIMESAKQVAAAIEIVAGNTTRGFAMVSRQVDTMGDEVSKSLNKLSGLLDRMLYKAPPPQQAATGTDASKVTHSDGKPDSGGSGLGWLAWFAKKVLPIGAILYGTYKMRRTTEDKDKMYNENVQRYGKSKADTLKQKQSGGITGWLNNRLDDAFEMFSGKKTPLGKSTIGDESVIHKMTYSADKITFTATNKIEFKSKTQSSGATSQPSGSGSTPTKSSGGMFNNFVDSLRGGPGGAGFFNTMADKVFGTGQKNSSGNDGDKRSGANPTTNTTTPPQSNAPPVTSKDSGDLFNPISAKSLSGRPGSDSASMGRGAHQGVDMMAPAGSPVYASKAGTILRIGTDNFGKPALTIKHDDGTYSRYLHMGDIDYKVGDKVEGGAVVGKSGSANGVDHLHFERWSQPPNREGKGLINPREEYGWDAKDSDGKKPTITGGEKVGGQPTESATKFGDIPPWMNNKLSGDDYQFKDGPRTGWSDFKQANYDGNDGSLKMIDRRDDPDPYKDDEYSIATMENEAKQRNAVTMPDIYKRDEEAFKPSPLGYALGGRDLIDYEQPKTDSASFQHMEEQSRWDALRPPDQPSPRPSRPDLPVTRSDTSGSGSQKAYQGIDSDLDHRPQQDAIPQQDFTDYMGTGSGN